MSLAVAGLLAALGCAAPVAASVSATQVHLDESVKATTTLAKLKQTIVIPPGTFVGTVSAATGAMSGTLTLPTATTTVAIAGIGLAKVQVSLEPTAPTTGVFNFATDVVNATSKFNIHVVSVEPLGLPVNLVGRRCTTSTPVSLSFTGVVPPFGTGKVGGTYTIPPLAHCGASTAVLNVAIAGGGNTFSATMAPASFG
jgi:hypothetical protein